MMTGQGHPGEDATRLGIYARHRVVSLHEGGMDARHISDYLRLPVFVVEHVLREVEEGREREW